MNDHDKHLNAPSTPDTSDAGHIPPSFSQCIWPAESLRTKLIELNRIALRDSPLPHLQGRDTWPNQSPELLPEELAAAQSVGVQAVSPGTPAFAIIMNGRERFHWAVLIDGTLRVSPATVRRGKSFVRISHAILSAGASVLAAGEGRTGVFLSNVTGHFKNDEYVVAPVLEAFAQFGILFKGQ